MNGRLSWRSARAACALLGTGALMLASASAAGATPVYNNIPVRLTRGVNSLGFEATSTSQFGGLIELSNTRRQRANPTITFVMDDWACQTGGGATCKSEKKSSYTWPVTVSINEVGPGDTVGPLLASKTESITVPYQPSASSKCTGEATGAWYDGKLKECIFGFAFKGSVQFPGVTMPSQAIVSVAYNTENYGAEPTGTEGPENSLNEGLVEVAPRAGSDPTPEQVYVDSSWSEMYCEGATDVGTFGPSGNCWAPYQPGFEVTAER